MLMRTRQEDSPPRIWEPKLLVMTAVVALGRRRLEQRLAGGNDAVAARTGHAEDEVLCAQARSSPAPGPAGVAFRFEVFDGACPPCLQFRKIGFSPDCQGIKQGIRWGGSCGNQQQGQPSALRCFLNPRGCQGDGRDLNAYSFEVVKFSNPAL